MPWNEFRTYIRHLPAREAQRVEDAFQLGKKAHMGQKRKSGEEYFNHPIAVAHMLVDLGADADAIIAALLHDAVEDTPLTLEQIEQKFGKTVSALIDGLTKLRSEDVALSPKLTEQVETLRKIFTLMQQDVRIMIIKLVDRLHNMQTAEFLSPERQQALAQETLEIFVKIADKLCMQDLRDELEGLCLSVLEPDSHQKLSEFRTMNEQKGLALIDTMKQALRTHDSHLISRTDLLFEDKMWDQLRSQSSVGSTVATGMSSITIAFVCEDTDACYRTLGALHQLWKREVLSFQDFINGPQLNGYRGLHTTVIAHDGTRVRCKIRTTEMHEYARKGVATVAFKGKTNIADILPWTKRITPLTVDTEGSSDNFWQSLKSDILGESIIIHGPDDTTVQLPHGATALDGAFYLFQEKALSTESIKMNGIATDFGNPLTNAASLNIVLADKDTVERDWLRHVQTGFAAAKIRSALMKQSEERKLFIGHEMLQQIFTERKRGFIEEFDEVTFDEQLKKLGYVSLSGVYMSIADGRVEPTDVFAALFEKPLKIQRTIATSRIQYTVNMDSVETMDRLNLIHRKYGGGLADIHYHRMSETKGSVSLRVRMLPQEITAFKEELSLAGAQEIDIISHTKREFFLLTALVVLWALNPVIAKWFLNQGMLPVTLITIRFLTFFLYTAGFYVLWRTFSQKSYVHIPNLMFRAVLPAAGLMGLSVFNYFALVQVSPSLHLTILRLNTLILPLITFFHKRLFPRRSLFLTLILLLSVIVLITLTPDSPPVTGLILSVMALFSYTLYSLTTEHLLQQQRISTRYPLFTFNIGILLGIAGVGLLLFQGYSSLIGPLTLPAILYVIFCVCIPHVFYYLLLRRMRFTYFTDILLLEVPLAILFEIFLLGLVLPLPLYFIIGFILAVLLLHRWEHVTLHAS